MPSHLTSSTKTTEDHVVSLSIETLAEIDRVVGQWCLNQVPVHIKHEVDYDYEVDGPSVLIFEVRPLWRGQPGEKTCRPFAKFRYFKLRNQWQIYWMRASEKWQIYEPQSTARNLEAAIKIMASDQYGCFFG